MIQTKFFCLKILIIFLLFGSCFHVIAAEAYNTHKDLKIIAQAVGFVKGRNYSDVSMLIVFSPDSAHSVSNADQVLEIIGDGFSFGKVRINARKATVREALQSSPDVYFFQSDLSNIARIYDHAARNGILTLSTHDACMQKNQCVLLIKTNPRVDIFLNREAADQSGIKFDAAFRLMVKEK